MRTPHLPYYGTIVCVAYDLPPWIPAFPVRHINQYPVDTLHGQIHVLITDHYLLPWQITDPVPPY